MNFSKINFDFFDLRSFLFFSFLAVVISYNKVKFLQGETHS